MSTPEGETTTATETAASGDPEEQTSITRLKPTETVEFWKQKAREQEKRAKDNADAASKLKEFEDRDKTEAQRLGEAAEAFQKRALEAEVQVLRLQVAADRGLTPAQAKRLVGTSREELEADADELLDTFKPAAEKAAEKETQVVATSLDLGHRGAPATTSDQDAARWLQNLTRR